ncbi:hypothetical protein [Pseudoruminococcus massiliensis]|uniref:hypothetical protein n=1 Tax=Pseudoruminococcus massiliensis TaxID=2086583 RepID=UPI0022E09A4A|nr:hypothetical protein [Pseudoruminococcus massiliensis]
MRKNTLKKILAALLALGAISALTACNNSQTTAQSTAESSKSVSESSTESSKESSAESSSESSVESSKAVSESSVESSKESSTESSSESSVESSNAISESSVESSKESSVTDPDASKTFSKSDVIRYGKTIVAAEAIALDYSAIDQLNSNTYVCILKINDDSYNILLHGKASSIEKKYVELLEEGFVPDSSKIDFLIN